MWLIGLIASLLCLVAIPAVLWAVTVAKKRKQHGLNMMHVLFAGVFLASTCLFLPAHIESGMESISAFLVSVFHAIQLFAAGCEFTEIREVEALCPRELWQWYVTWAGVLYVLAPLVTFGFVLSLFKNVVAYARYLRLYWRDVYVFTEMNQRSLALAEDLRANHPRAGLVFTDVYEEDGEAAHEMLGQAKALNAICFKKDVLAVRFGCHSKRRHLYFFAIGDNEGENAQQAMQLIDQYRHRESTDLYIFSTKLQSALLLTAVDKGCMKVRRISEVQSLVNRVLYEQGHVLFDSARPMADGRKKISAVVVGLGSHGTEMLKALAWYGQMDGYALEITAFDRDEMADRVLSAQAPELMSPVYNGVCVEGEAQYKIRVVPGVRVETDLFAQQIAQLTDTSYVLVALGDDDRNIETAVTLRMYFERMGIHPVIQAIVYHSRQRQALQDIHNYRGQSYDISWIGDLQASYTESVILDSELEEEALRRHLKWGEEEEFWKYEYNYRSSVASALHMRARIHCGIPGADKAEDQLTPQERDGIEVLEHRRWNAYMRSRGYVFSGSTDRSSRNDLAKMHHDLVCFEALTEEEKRKDGAVGSQ